MRILITAGPTRQYIDPVRFITNASSGRMGYALAAAAACQGHDVTLLTGPVWIAPPGGCRLVRFVTVAELTEGLDEHFPACDALVMAAAVGDFRPARQRDQKLRRCDGPVEIRLLPTQDVLATVTGTKRADQLIVAFAVEEGPDDKIEVAARAKLEAKGADYIVANTVDAMGADKSRAAILSATEVVLPWAVRTKEQLAEQIVRLVTNPRAQGS